MNYILQRRAGTFLAWESNWCILNDFSRWCRRRFLLSTLRVWPLHLELGSLGPPCTIRAQSVMEVTWELWSRHLTWAGTSSWRKIHRWLTGSHERIPKAENTNICHLRVAKDWSISFFTVLQYNIVILQLILLNFNVEILFLMWTMTTNYIIIKLKLSFCENQFNRHDKNSFVTNERKFSNKGTTPINKLLHFN